ncbi:MAG: response regulator transcription factor [Acidobacteria bacterium]|nr:response regulator transcription factor [Acidobacteriota bacterium]
MRAVTTGKPQVVVVEDEPELRLLLTDNLSAEGYDVWAAADGETAVPHIEARPPALILLDVLLPRMSGFEVLNRVRSRGIHSPVIVLTARAAESDRIIGLDLGADDYVTKPFSLRELFARVRAQMRRDDWRGGEPGEFTFGDVVVNVRKRLVTRRGRRLELSTREFELLRYLLAHQGEVVSREQLLRDVWGYSQSMVTRTVDNYVMRLRAHLEPQPHDPRHLLTIHGEGYQLLA